MLEVLQCEHCDHPGAPEKLGGMGSETLNRITANDEEIRLALEEASVPALMTALVHLTGDIGG